MTSEEIAISQSTPHYRFDVAQVPTPRKPGVEAPLQLDPKAEAFVASITSDTGQPVVMFALEWCEFSWSVRNRHVASAPCGRRIY
jgi:cysteine synthase A